MARHHAAFRFTTEYAAEIYRALSPELKDEGHLRSHAICCLEGQETLILAIEAQDIASLRASINMLLRLVSVADEMQHLIHSPPSQERRVSPAI